MRSFLTIKMAALAGCLCWAFAFSSQSDVGSGDIATASCEPPSASMARSWCHWHKCGDEVCDECYGRSKRSCKKAEDNWRKQTGFPPIIFPCEKISMQLLKKAHEQCEAKKEYACS